MDNEQIACVFEELADLLELSGESVFRVRAYRTGAKAIRDLDESVASILTSSDRKLTDVDGIGQTLADKAKILVETGKLPALEKMLTQLPRSLLDVMRVPGVGAKRAAKLFLELGVTDLASLRAVCESQKVRSIKGFGEKIERAMLEGLSIAEQASHRLLISDAGQLVDRLQAHMGLCKQLEKFEFSGSFRRGKETIGDLDVLAIGNDTISIMDHFALFPDRIDTIVRGDTKMSIRVLDAFQIDLRVVPKESWGAALQYFTGSKEHNVRVRIIAKQMGLRINEYGVFDAEDPNRQLAGVSEEEVYAAIGMPCVPPELREGRFEFDPNLKDWIDDLITLEDIRGDMHMHTTETDGQQSLREMVAAAQCRGLSYIAITDHSKRVSVARGLDSQRLLAQWEEIDSLNVELKGSFRVLRGIECDILEAGGMDLPDEVLAKADWVMASIHFGQKQSRQQITDRIIGAIKNQHVSAISHPTGRLIHRRDPYEVDLEAVMQAAAEHGKLLELNANPHRLDLSDIHCIAAKRAGVKIVISTDAHSVEGLDLMRYGIQQARRAGLCRNDIFNTRSLSSLLKALPGR